MAGYKYTLRKGDAVEQTNSVERKVQLEFDGYKLDAPTEKAARPKAGGEEKAVVRH
jgi:hypothetical protein